jgi:hypothetical protein
MKMHNDDELFSAEDDLADVPDPRAKGQRVHGDFYMCPKAGAVSGSSAVAAERLCDGKRQAIPQGTTAAYSAVTNAPAVMPNGLRGDDSELEEFGA